MLLPKEEGKIKIKKCLQMEKKIQKNYKINIRKLEKKLESENGSRIERGGESETELGKYRTGERKRERKR